MKPSVRYPHRSGALALLFTVLALTPDVRPLLAQDYVLTRASSFGLLHGFGFATVLADIGLPRGDVATALLFFNLGVEIGQVLFVAALASLFMASRRVFASPPGQGLAAPATYVMGIVASFWFVERVAAFWPGS